MFEPGHSLRASFPETKRLSVWNFGATSFKRRHLRLLRTTCLPRCCKGFEHAMYLWSVRRWRLSRAAIPKSALRFANPQTTHTITAVQALQRRAPWSKLFKRSPRPSGQELQIRHALHLLGGGAFVAVFPTRTIGKSALRFVASQTTQTRVSEQALQFAEPGELDHKDNFMLSGHVGHLEQDLHRRCSRVLFYQNIFTIFTRCFIILACGTCSGPCAKVKLRFEVGGLRFRGAVVC